MFAKLRGDKKEKPAKKEERLVGLWKTLVKIALKDGYLKYALNIYEEDSDLAKFQALSKHAKQVVGTLPETPVSVTLELDASHQGPLGIKLRSDGKVVKIARNSWASHWGMQVGDEILAIDGEPPWYSDNLVNNHITKMGSIAIAEKTKVRDLDGPVRLTIRVLEEPCLLKKALRAAYTPNDVPGSVGVWEAEDQRHELRRALEAEEQRQEFRQALTDAVSEEMQPWLAEQARAEIDKMEEEEHSFHEKSKQRDMLRSGTCISRNHEMNQDIGERHDRGMNATVVRERMYGEVSKIDREQWREEQIEKVILRKQLEAQLKMENRIRKEDEDAEKKRSAKSPERSEHFAQMRHQDEREASKQDVLDTSLVRKPLTQAEDITKMHARRLEQERALMRRRVFREEQRRAEVGAREERRAEEVARAKAEGKSGVAEQIQQALAAEAEKQRAEQKERERNLLQEKMEHDKHVLEQELAAQKRQLLEHAQADKTAKDQQQSQLQQQFEEAKRQMLQQQEKERQALQKQRVEDQMRFQQELTQQKSQAASLSQVHARAEMQSQLEEANRRMLQEQEMQRELLEQKRLEDQMRFQQELAQQKQQLASQAQADEKSREEGARARHQQLENDQAEMRRKFGEEEAQMLRTQDRERELLQEKVVEDQARIQQELAQQRQQLVSQDASAREQAETQHQRLEIEQADMQHQLEEARRQMLKKQERDLKWLEESKFEDQLRLQQEFEEQKQQMALKVEADKKHHEELGEYLDRRLKEQQAEMRQVEDDKQKLEAQLQAERLEKEEASQEAYLEHLAEEHAKRMQKKTRPWQETVSQVEQSHDSQRLSMFSHMTDESEVREEPDTGKHEITSNLISKKLAPDTENTSDPHKQQLESSAGPASTKMGGKQKVSFLGGGALNTQGQTAHRKRMSGNPMTRLRSSQVMAQDPTLSIGSTSKSEKRTGKSPPAALIKPIIHSQGISQSRTTDDVASEFVGKAVNKAPAYETVFDAATKTIAKGNRIKKKARKEGARSESPISKSKIIAATRTKRDENAGLASDKNRKKMNNVVHSDLDSDDDDGIFGLSGLFGVRTDDNATPKNERLAPGLTDASLARAEKTSSADHGVASIEPSTSDPVNGSHGEQEKKSASKKEVSDHEDDGMFGFTGLFGSGHDDGPVPQAEITAEKTGQHAHDGQEQLNLGELSRRGAAQGEALESNINTEDDGLFGLTGLFGSGLASGVNEHSNDNEAEFKQEQTSKNDDAQRGASHPHSVDAEDDGVFGLTNLFGTQVDPSEQDGTCQPQSEAEATDGRMMVASIQDETKNIEQKAQGRKYFPKFLTKFRKGKAQEASDPEAISTQVSMQSSNIDNGLSASNLQADASQSPKKTNVKIEEQANDDGRFADPDDGVFGLTNLFASTAVESAPGELTAQDETKLLTSEPKPESTSAKKDNDGGKSWWKSNKSKQEGIGKQKDDLTAPVGDEIGVAVEDDGVFGLTGLFTSNAVDSVEGEPINQDVSQLATSKQKQETSSTRKDNDGGKSWWKSNKPKQETKDNIAAPVGDEVGITGEDDGVFGLTGLFTSNVVDSVEAEPAPQNRATNNTQQDNNGGKSWWKSNKSKQEANNKQKDNLAAAVGDELGATDGDDGVFGLTGLFASNVVDSAEGELVAQTQEASSTKKDIGGKSWWKSNKSKQETTNKQKDNIDDEVGDADDGVFGLTGLFTSNVVDSVEGELVAQSQEASSTQKANNGGKSWWKSNKAKQEANSKQKDNLAAPVGDEVGAKGEDDGVFGLAGLFG